MRVPSALEDASKSGRVQDLIDAVAVIPGATWLKFSSTSVDNDSDGADRVLVRVPDTEDPPRFEQWIQIAISRSTGRLGRNVDFLARQLVSDEMSPIDEGSVVAFRGYSRTANGFVPEGRGSSSELSRCYSCHPSGLRPVSFPQLQVRRSQPVSGQCARHDAGRSPTGGGLDNFQTSSSELASSGQSGARLRGGWPIRPSSRLTLPRSDVAQAPAMRLVRCRRLPNPMTMQAPMILKASIQVDDVEPRPGRGLVAQLMNIASASGEALHRGCPFPVGLPAHRLRRPEVLVGLRSDHWRVAPRSADHDQSRHQFRRQSAISSAWRTSLACSRR